MASSNSIDESAGGGVPSGETPIGLDRLRRFFAYMFARHDSGEQLPPMPQELGEWAQDTTVAAFAGTLLGGFQQWRHERSAGPIQPPENAPTKAHAARAMAEEQTQRLLRVVNASVKGTARFGALAGVFYGTHLMSSVWRARHDFYNAAFGGLAAGALLGLSLSERGPGLRLRGAILGAALGASIGVPAGLLQDKLVEMLPVDQQLQRRRRIQETETIIAGNVPRERPVRPPGYDPAGAVIRQLEASLEGSPTRAVATSEVKESKGESRRSWKFWK